MVFLADRRRIIDGNLENEVDFVVGSAVFDVAVLHSANEARDLGFGTEFFGKLANKSDFHPLARFDVAARQNDQDLLR